MEKVEGTGLKPCVLRRIGKLKKAYPTMTDEEAGKLAVLQYNRNGDLYRKILTGEVRTLYKTIAVEGGLCHDILRIVSAKEKEDGGYEVEVKSIWTMESLRYDLSDVMTWEETYEDE